MSTSTITITNETATSASLARDNGEPPAAKRLRSCKADIIVAVGNGDFIREFPCYRIVLCLASDYFDAMLSTSMAERYKSRIEFLDKDPEEWELVYSFMDPATAACARVRADNAEMLLPWFHEFQMHSLVDKCDDALGGIARALAGKKYWSKWMTEGRRQNFDHLLTLVSMSEMYALPKTAWETCKVISDVFCYGCDLVTLKDVKQLAPFLQQKEQNSLLLQTIDGFLPQDFAPKAREMEKDVFSPIIYAGLRTRTNNIKLHMAQTKVRKAERAIESAISFPEELYERLPNRKSLSSEYGDKINEVAMYEMKIIMYKKWKDNGIVELPESWKDPWL